MFKRLGGVLIESFLWLYVALAYAYGGFLFWRLALADLSYGGLLFVLPYLWGAHRVLRAAGRDLFNHK